MEKNIGKSEKTVRIAAAIVLIVLDYFNVVTGTFSWILSLVSLALLITALVGYCPIYTLLKKNTNK